MMSFYPILRLSRARVRFSPPAICNSSILRSCWRAFHVSIFQVLVPFLLFFLMFLLPVSSFPSIAPCWASWYGSLKSQLGQLDGERETSRGGNDIV